MSRRRVALGLALALGLAGCGGRSVAGPNGVPDFDFGSNDAHRVDAFGDSITLGELGPPGLRRRTSPRVTRNNYPVNLEALLQGLDPAWRVLNRGVGGETTASGLRRFPGVLARDHPGFVLIMEGTNDANQDRDPDAIAANVEAMVGHAQANRTIPIVGTIPPNFRDDLHAQTIIAESNARIRTMTAARGVVLAEIFEGMNDRDLFGSPDEGIRDPLHPNERGYAVMARIWFDAMQRAIPRARGQ